MAEFEIAHRILERLEGLHSNDPVDRGGETVLGIARKHHPEWDGWSFWDMGIRDFSLLKGMARRFYRSCYWMPLNAHQYPTQRLANIVYQAGVNVGVRRAARWLQRACNEVTGSTLKVDGLVGNHTLHALYEGLSRIGEVENTCLKLQREHYLNLVAKDASQEKFLRGWMNRIEGL
jgi:lysozyme family protein